MSTHLVSYKGRKIALMLCKNNAGLEIHEIAITNAIQICVAFLYTFGRKNSVQCLAVDVCCILSIGSKF